MLEEEEESSLSKTPHHGDVLSPSPEQRLLVGAHHARSTPLWVAPPWFYSLKMCAHVHAFGISHLGAVQPHRIGGDKTAPRAADTRFILPTERQG